MTWSVDKCDFPGYSLHLAFLLTTWKDNVFVIFFMKALVLDRESANRLCDGTVLFRTFVVVGPERVKEGCLSMVDVAHDCNDRSTSHVVRGLIL